MIKITKTISSTKRVYGLDILRSIAIMAVLLGHSAALLPPYVNDFCYHYMIDGVSIFFVLSGFLIGNILLKMINETEFSFNDLYNFWIRRWLRTLPAFFCVVVFLFSFYWFIDTLPPKKLMLECLTFSQSLLFGKSTLYPESWTLAIEEWFYFVIPLLLFICFKLIKINRNKIFITTAFLVIIITTIVRCYVTSKINYSDLAIWDFATRRPVFLRLDSIMFGVLGSYLFYHNKKIWAFKNLCFALGLLFHISLYIINKNQFFHYSVLSIESIGTFLLLPKLSSLKTGKGVVYKTITFISIISYSLYLLNLTPFFTIVFPYFKKWLPITENSIKYYSITLFFYFTSITLSAYLLYKSIEKPFMQLRERFSKKTKQYLLKLEVSTLG